MVWYFTGVYIINRTLHGRLKIRNFSSRVEKIFHSFDALSREIFFNSRRDFSYLRAAMFIYGKQGRIMENLISVSVGLNSGMLFKKI